MKSKKSVKLSALYVASLMLTACQTQDFSNIKPDFSQIKNIPASILSIGKRSTSSIYNNTDGSTAGKPLPLKEILGEALASENQGTDFRSSIKYALETDPEIVSKQRDLEAKVALVRVVEAQKDFQVGTTLYGGIEDVTDNTKGLALAINVMWFTMVVN